MVEDDPSPVQAHDPPASAKTPPKAGILVEDPPEIQRRHSHRRLHRVAGPEFCRWWGTPASGSGWLDGWTDRDRAGARYPKTGPNSGGIEILPPPRWFLWGPDRPCLARLPPAPVLSPPLWDPASVDGQGPGSAPKTAAISAIPSLTTWASKAVWPDPLEYPYMAGLIERMCTPMWSRSMVRRRSAGSSRVGSHCIREALSPSRPRVHAIVREPQGHAKERLAPPGGLVQRCGHRVRVNVDRQVGLIASGSFRLPTSAACEPHHPKWTGGAYGADPRTIVRRLGGWSFRPLGASTGAGTCTRRSRVGD